MRPGPILLEHDPFELPKVLFDGVHELIFQHCLVSRPVNALWEAAGVADALAGDASPDLKFVTPKFGHWLHHLGVQLLTSEPPHELPSDSFVSVEG
jgi:hypothetical protein